VKADRGNVVIEVKLTNGRGEAMYNGDRSLLVGREIVPGVFQIPINGIVGVEEVVI
jgi:hypothetical protein